MAGRAQAFSDPTIIALASERFIPVAENSSPLQGQRDAKGEFFRLVAEQGHYAGRTFPTGTRQGMYAFTADGKVLAAGNTRDPERLATLMHTALARWGRLVDSGGGAGEVVAPGGAAVGEYDPAVPDRYPVDGLVLQVVARDLPRDEDARKEDWRKEAWNLDYAWFTRQEARSIVPAVRTLGSRQAVPWEIVRRMARFHLRDFVRGEPSVWPEAAIRQGEIVAEITGVEGDSASGSRSGDARSTGSPRVGRVQLHLEGTIRLQWDARWVRPEDGEERCSDSGFDARVYGEGVWDEGRDAFVALEMVAVGPRWGANQYNNRADDLGPAPLGVVFTLAGAVPRDRTPPHTIYRRDYFGDAGGPGTSPEGASSPGNGVSDGVSGRDVARDDRDVGQGVTGARAPAVR
ncbi:MAG: hypothetical protein M3442_22070 [Chloroflexota bacterium]|nr:hypothetical protein [Chloroflexota bacterium]